MAGDPTPTTPDASAVPAPAVEAPTAAESAPLVEDTSVEVAEEPSASVGGGKSGGSSATPMEVNEQPAVSEDAGALLTSIEKTEGAHTEASGEEESSAEVKGDAEAPEAGGEKEASSETPTVEKSAGSSDQPSEADAQDASATKESVAAEHKEGDSSDPVSAKADEETDSKQEDAGVKETPAGDAVAATDATSDQKEAESTQKDADVKESPDENVANVEMTPAENPMDDKEKPAKSPEPVVEEANGDLKDAESVVKPIEEAAPSDPGDTAKPAEEAASSSSSDAVKPEQEQVPEVSGKRKEREEDQVPPASNTQPATAKYVANDEESATKKQKVEAPGEPSVPTDEADTATATIAAAPIMISRDDMAKMEEDDGVLKFDVITNDGEPEHMVQLTTLKNIFAKQLPKMPKEYIVRLVFDRNHRSMIILKNGKHVIGGICYRPFEPNRFAEIAFCAINASDQVKGYGTRLMNHLKEYVKLKGITHFLTYADNYAIGYFKKQGFSKVVSMPRPNWFGYIKDYDGGTLMECTIHHQINYLRITSMVQKQRQAILDKIKQNSKAHIVYPGLAKFAEGRLLDIYMIPGVKEAGWSQATIRNNRIGTRDPGSLKTQLTQLWKAVSSHRSAWPFHEPVDTNVVVDYLNYIKEPIDLTTIGKRVESGAYVSKAQFKADLDKMCTNCTVYNLPDTNYYKAAVDLQEFINKRVQVRDQPR